MTTYIRIGENLINKFPLAGISSTFDTQSPLFETMKSEITAGTATYTDETGLPPLSL